MIWVTFQMLTFYFRIERHNPLRESGLPNGKFGLLYYFGFVDFNLLIE